MPTFSSSTRCLSILVFSLISALPCIDGYTFCFDKEDGLYASAYDCEFYFKCEQFVTSIERCEERTFFDFKERRCKTNAECLAPPFPNCGFDCSVHEHGSRLPNPQDCGSYFQCVWGDPILLPCPEGTLFDPEPSVRDCVMPTNVNCEQCIENATTTATTPEFSSTTQFAEETTIMESETTFTSTLPWETTTEDPFYPSTITTLTEKPTFWERFIANTPVFVISVLFSSALIAAVTISLFHFFLPSVGVATFLPCIRNSISSELKNSIIDSENVNSDSENFKTDSENVNTDSENVNTDSENVNTDSKNVAIDSENVIISSGNVTVNSESVKIEMSVLGESSTDDIDIVYHQWIDKRLSRFVYMSKNIDELRIYLGDGILTLEDDKEIRNCTECLDRKFRILYNKVKAAGFANIDVIIRALQETGQSHIAEKFQKFKNNQFLWNDLAAHTSTDGHESERKYFNIDGTASSVVIHVEKANRVEIFPHTIRLKKHATC